MVEFAHYYHQPVKVDIYKIAVITPKFITLKSKSGDYRNNPTTPYKPDWSELDTQPFIGTAIELYSEDSLIAWQNAIKTYADNTYKDNTDVI